MNKRWAACLPYSIYRLLSHVPNEVESRTGRNVMCEGYIRREWLSSVNNCALSVHETVFNVCVRAVADVCFSSQSHRHNVQTPAEETLRCMCTTWFTAIP